METLSQKEKDLLEEIKEAGQPVNFFTVKIEYNNKVLLGRKDFPADKYYPETLETTAWRFLANDLARLAIEKIKEENEKIKEQKRAEE